MWRRCRAQHDIHGRENVGDPIEGYRLPVVLAGQSDRPVIRAVCDCDTLNALPGERLKDELPGDPRPEDQDALPLEGSEDLPGQLDGDRRDGCGALADRGLRPNLSSGGEGRLEQPRQDGPDEGRRECQVSGLPVGVPHLTLDLRLSGHHRVQPGGHPEQVLYGDLSPLLEQVSLEISLDPPHAAFEEARDAAQSPFRGRGKEVDLSTIAGREEDGFFHSLAVSERAERFRRLPRAVGELLTDLDRCSLVAHAHHRQRQTHRCPTPPGLTGRVRFRPR